MGSNDYRQSIERILAQFALFSNYINTKTKNIFRIYIVKINLKKVYVFTAAIYTLFLLYTVIKILLTQILFFMETAKLKKMKRAILY